ncbi:MAG: hypothetical protein FJ291_01600 [Planctomycetes bacterium]|nr:hypothetical protein [Planctomycetota bacterium]
MNKPTVPLAFALGLCAAAASGEAAEHGHAEGGHAHEHDFAVVPPALGASLRDGWLDRWPHSHYSRRGTPFVHTFVSEPAFLDRDFFLDFSLAKGKDGVEAEAEAELEWAITRRIGLVVEAPFVYLNPDGGGTERGLGDVAVAPRLLLLDYDRFLLSANVEFQFSTGDEKRGLGAGETVFAPSLSSWLDLGGNLTLHNNAGFERGLSSGSDAFVWGGALTCSIYTRGTPVVLRADGAVRGHFPAGLLNLIAEIRGEHPLDGPDEGEGTGRWILGASYSLSPHVEVRGALMFPAWNPRDLDGGAILGLIYHF